MEKPILIGLNNPVSTRLGHELYPLPEGCTGNRLWKMLNSRTGATMRNYLETFERRNLVRAPAYDKLAGRARAYEIITELKNSHRTVVLLGNVVREAVDWAFRNDHGRMLFGGASGLPPLLVHPQEVGGCIWRQIPHPSGRNLFYNDEKNRELVALLLEELYLSYNGLTTKKEENAQ